MWQVCKVAARAAAAAYSQAFLLEKADEGGGDRFCGRARHFVDLATLDDK